MLPDRPVVAFHYDYEDYSRDTRDAYFDFEEYMPEVRAYNMAELEESVQRLLQRDEAAGKRKRFRGRLYKDADCDLAERLVRWIGKMK